MSHFDGVGTLAAGRQLYRELLMKNHPDRGGDAEVFKQVQNDFEIFLRHVSWDDTRGAVNEDDTLRRRGKRTRMDWDPEYAKRFYEVLRTVCEFNVDVEVIGDWIHVKNFQGYQFKLTMMGFWWSRAHQCLIWNGEGQPRGNATGVSTDYLRSRYGAERKRDKRYV